MVSTQAAYALRFMTTLFRSIFFACDCSGKSIGWVAVAVHLEVPGFLASLDRAAADEEQVAALEQSIAGWSQIMQQVMDQQQALQLPKVHGQRLLTWTHALPLPPAHAFPPSKWDSSAQQTIAITPIQRETVMYWTQQRACNVKQYGPPP